MPPATAVILIEIDGLLAAGVHGFVIQSPNNRIQDLAINNFEQDGIRIEATPFPTAQNYVWGNFIGTDPSGLVVKSNGRNHASL